MISALRAAQERARLFSHIDWFLFASALAISLLGLVTMRSFSVENSFFDKQMIWICISIACFFAASIPEYHFLRRTPVITSLFIITTVSLALIFLFGAFVKGAQNRFNLGFLSVQPSDPAKLLLVLMLAKYFARRHVEIAAVKHILVSGAYALALFILIFFQPDFGSAIIIGSIWLGMVLAAGISWKHLAALFIAAIVVKTGLWQYGLQPYQKQRILTFIHPLTDIQGTGYNAYQSTIAVGSGEWLGKGIGYGTQSKLRFLPEYQTDFIFAAFAEEWGFVGVLLLFSLYGVLFWRLLAAAARGASNFETLFALGVLCYFGAHFLLHTGINVGILPVTGTTIPFMSYGGSHLLAEFLSLGILSGMNSYARAAHRDALDRELTI